MAMHEGYRHTAFADGGCKSFDRSTADIADGECPRYGRFEMKRSALERPAGRLTSAHQEIGAGHEEARWISDDRGILCPLGVGQSSRHTNRCDVGSQFAPFV